MLPSDPVPNTKIEQYRDWLRFWVYEDLGIPEAFGMETWMPRWAVEASRRERVTRRTSALPLRRRHRRVLQLRAAGLTLAAIAARLGVCTSNVGEALRVGLRRVEQHDPPPAPAEGVVFVQATNTPGELYFPTLGKMFRLVELKDE